MPLPAVRRPTATDGVAFAVEQFTNKRSQAARTKPLVNNAAYDDRMRSPISSLFEIIMDSVEVLHGFLREGGQVS